MHYMLAEYFVLYAHFTIVLVINKKYIAWILCIQYEFIRAMLFMCWQKGMHGYFCA